MRVETAGNRFPRIVAGKESAPDALNRIRLKIERGAPENLPLGHPVLVTFDCSASAYEVDHLHIVAVFDNRIAIFVLRDGFPVNHYN